MAACLKKLKKLKGLASRLCLAFLTAVIIPSLGCHGGGSGELTGKEQHAFDNAAPEVAQSWAAAVEASRTNDYFGAQTLLYRLLRQELNPDQKRAVEHQLTIVTARLDAGLAKGDPAARAALDQLHSNPPNRLR